MSHINPDAAPFALTLDNEVPKNIRDTTYWDDNGDVLLVTKDGIAFLLQMELLLRYSETVKSLLGHIAGMPQDGLWTPILELECSATELRAVLEYLLLQQGTQPSIDSLARYAFSAYTLGIKKLDEAALAALLNWTCDRLNAYENWDGIAEFQPPPLKSVHAILAGRALPEPASSILGVAFVDSSVFALEEAALYPQIEAPKLQGPHDEDTIALLRERNSELVGSLLKLCTSFGRHRSLSKVGRPCCNFKAVAADHVPDLHANATSKGRFALSIIVALGAELERARSRQALAEDGSQQEGQQPAGQNENRGCLKCLTELHQGMRRLYSQWWEDMGRLLMGEPQDGRSSAWDDVRNGLSTSRTPVPSDGWPEKLRRFLHRIYDTIFRFRH
ncbi:hypothetical protein BJV74DRAFT_380157 [Russula compacta]|nr:hypothetical protein BJV74DRAFT_380157 [Russula compacta]